MIKIINRDWVVPFQTKDSSIIREIIHPRSSSAAHQSLAEATLVPGTKTQAHFHSASEEIYYIVAGQAEMRLKNERALLAPGDAVVIAPHAPHQIRNVGQGDLVLLCCCAPAYSHQDTTLCDDLFND